MSLLRGQPIPPDRFTIVLRHALAFLVHDPQPELGEGTPLLNKDAERFDCSGVVAALPR